MTQWHDKGKRKSSGGIRASRRRRDKILSHKGSEPTLSIVKQGAKEEKRKTQKGLANNKKVKLLATKQAAVTLPKEKKTVKAEIVSVTENKANRLYTRRNIVTKGCTIKVKIEGKEQLARVTSRPGQHGIVQAVLLEEKK